MIRYSSSSRITGQGVKIFRQKFLLSPPLTTMITISETCINMRYMFRSSSCPGFIKPSTFSEFSALSTPKTYSSMKSAADADSITDKIKSTSSLRDTSPHSSNTSNLSSSTPLIETQSESIHPNIYLERKQELMNQIQHQLYNQVISILDTSDGLHHSSENRKRNNKTLRTRQERKERYEFFRRNSDAYWDQRRDRLRRRSTNNNGNNGGVYYSDNGHLLDVEDEELQERYRGDDQGATISQTDASNTAPSAETEYKATSSEYNDQYRYDDEKELSKENLITSASFTSSEETKKTEQLKEPGESSLLMDLLSSDPDGNAELRVEHTSNTNTVNNKPSTSSMSSTNVPQAKPSLLDILSSSNDDGDSIDINSTLSMDTPNDKRLKSDPNSISSQSPDTLLDPTSVKINDSLIDLLSDENDDYFDEDDEGSPKFQSSFKADDNYNSIHRTYKEHNSSSDFQLGNDGLFSDDITLTGEKRNLPHITDDSRAHNQDDDERMQPLSINVTSDDDDHDNNLIDKSLMELLQETQNESTVAAPLVYDESGNIDSQESLPSLKDLLLTTKSRLKQEAKNESSIVTPVAYDDDMNMNSELSPTLEDVLLAAISLNSVMSREDWNDLKDYDTMIDDEYHQDDNETHLDSEEGEVDHPTTMHFIDELLKGSSADNWNLGTDEFNILLLYLGTTDVPNQVELMLKVFQQMNELSSSEDKASAPDSNTFSIILNYFFRQNASAVAAKLIICSEIIERDHKKVIDGDPSSPQSCILDEEVVVVAMKILRDIHDVENTERLLQLALSENGHGVKVQSSAFRYLLQLYQSEDKKEEALQLIRSCIKENSFYDRRGVDIFLIAATRWPRKQRDGKKIPVALYCRSLLDLLIELQDLYTPSYNVWKNLMKLASYAAKTESQNSWMIVHHSCKALMRDHLDPNKELEHLILKLGLEASTKMKDPLLAVALLTRYHDDKVGEKVDDGVHSLDVPQDGLSNNDDEQDEHNDNDEESDTIFWNPHQTSTSSKKINSQVSQDAYLETVKLCLECGRIDLAEDVLNSCSTMQEMTASQVRAMIMSEYAKEGSLERAETFMDSIGSKKSEQIYAAFIHNLAVNHQREKALMVLNGMINDAYGDGIKPGLSSYTAYMLSAMFDSAWKEVIRINKQMISHGIAPNTDTSYAFIMAKTQLAMEAKDSIPFEAMEDIYTSQIPIDQRSFFLCSKILFSETDSITVNDNESFRLELRRLAEIKPEIAAEAIALQRLLVKASNEDQRVPSGLNNVVMIRQKSESLWRQALNSAIKLSRVSQKIS